MSALRSLKMPAIPVSAAMASMLRRKRSNTGPRRSVRS